MTIHEYQKKILQLKKEQDICILAHSYQAREITEIADFTGDSFQLSVQAKNAPQSTVLMCGVRFMAETVKLRLFVNSCGKSVKIKLSGGSVYAAPHKILCKHPSNQTTPWLARQAHRWISS